MATAAKRMPMGASIVHGCDISSYQRKFNFSQALAEGKQFCMIKAWENAEDPWFPVHWQDAKSAGVIRAPYCFMHPLKNPVGQVEAMLSVVRLQPGDLVPMVDVEWADGMKVLGARGAENILLAMQKIEAELGHGPIMYTANSFFQGVPADLVKEFSKYPICLAEYPSNGLAAGPMVPAGFPGWAWWQYTDHEAVSGQRVDADIFNGDLNQLKKYCL